MKTQIKYRQNTSLTRDCPTNGLPLPPPLRGAMVSPPNPDQPETPMRPTETLPLPHSRPKGDKRNEREIEGKTEPTEHLMAAIRAG